MGGLLLQYPHYNRYEYESQQFILGHLWFPTICAYNSCVGRSGIFWRMNLQNPSWWGRCRSLACLMIMNPFRVITARPVFLKRWALFLLCSFCFLANEYWCGFGSKSYIYIYIERERERERQMLEICIYIYMRVYIHINKWLNIYIYIYMCNTQTSISICKYISIHNICVCIYVYQMYVCVYVNVLHV